MRKFAALTLVFVAGATAASSNGDDLKRDEQWPHWRGPLATGVAPQANPPVRWDEKTNIKWKVPLPGRGSATPIIWGDNVFIAAALDTRRAAKEADIPKNKSKVKEKTTRPKTYYQFLLYCFDRQTGKERWKQICTERVPHEGYQETHSYAAGSPTTDGKRVWVSFGSNGVYCYDFDGKLQWQRELGLITTLSGYGEAITPVLHGNDLILTWDGEFNSRLFVLDANTGKTRLEILRDETTSWSTPLVVEHKGQTQVIVSGTKRVRSYDLATGKELWQVGGKPFIAIPSPVASDGVAYVMAGYVTPQAMAVPLDARGELTGTNKVLWTHKKGTPYVPSPLLADGRLYFTYLNNNLLTCLDAKSGKAHFEQVRLNKVNSLYASPVAAAGRIYLVDRDGTALILRLSNKVEVLATNSLNDNIDASPATVGRQLFLRGHKYLYCIEQP